MAGRVAGSAERRAAQHLLTVAKEPQALAVWREVHAVAGAGLAYDLRIAGFIVRHPEVVLACEADDFRIRVDRMAGIIDQPVRMVGMEMGQQDMSDVRR